MLIQGDHAGPHRAQQGRCAGVAREPDRRLLDDAIANIERVDERQKPQPDERNKPTSGRQKQARHAGNYFNASRWPSNTAG